MSGKDKYLTTQRIALSTNSFLVKLRDFVQSQSKLESSIEEKFDVLYQALQRKRNGTVWILDISIGHAGQKFDPKSLPNESNDVQIKSKCPVKQHSCSRSPHCKSEWNKIGCIEMYRLKSVDERISFLKDMKSCTKCGRKFSKMHMCRNYRRLCRMKVQT